jgi:Flp pilus assembly pilin Flp
MKMNKSLKSCRAIAMTEYLIILGIVAIAAIAIVGIFGKQIKNTFYRSTSTLGGTDSSAANASSIAGAASSAASNVQNMSDFDNKQNTGH